MKKSTLLSCMLVSSAVVIQAGTPRNISAVKAEGKITVDGKLDEPSWKNAPASAPLVEMVKGGKAADNVATSFRVLYDDRGIYFGIKSNEPTPKKLKLDAPKVLDSAVWTNDDVEVFLDPIGDRIEYYQFAASSGGAQCELYFIEGGNTGKSGFNPLWQTKSFVGTDYYSTEMFIPFSALNVRTLKPGKQNWIVSVSRQRIAGNKKRGYYIFNRGGKSGFHNISAWGKLQNITVPAGYDIYGDNPTVATSKQTDNYLAVPTIDLLNRGKAARKVIVNAKIDGKTTSREITLAAGKVFTAELPAVKISSEGIKQVIFSVTDADSKKTLFSNIAVLKFKYQPIKLTVTQPAYRNNIYFTQTINEISADIKLNLPKAKLRNGKIAASFTTSGNEQIWSKVYPIPENSAKQTIGIPAAKLNIGTYRLKVKVLSNAGKELAATSTDISKLGNAPGSEVRIDLKGNTVINGVPLFIRGFYGSYVYCLSPASMAGIKMPRSINFMMGGNDIESTRLGYKYLIGLTRIPGLEHAAKAGIKLPESVKAAVLKKVAEAKYSRDAIGYYLSDEPECRGLSAETLRELYELIKKADPYRLCLIVSRAPATYFEACDVICPHPYNNPIIKNRVRQFSRDNTDTHRKMAEGFKAVKGQAKGLWIMPQVFSYYNFGAMNVSVSPDFEQARWSIYTGVANHATGVVPFIFSGYWNDIECRIGVSHVMDTLAWLEPAWTEGDEVKIITSCSNDAAVDAITKKYKSRRKTDLYIVAANRSETGTTAKFTIPEASKYKRVYVLRENRSIRLKNGCFEDTFTKNGVHIYTTCDQLPILKSIKEIKAQIAAIKAYPKNGKNLLRNGTVHWETTVNGRDNRIFGDSLADGNLDSPGWLPWYGNKTELSLIFPDGVKFNKLVFYSPNLQQARLEVWDYGKWRLLKQWKDIHSFKTTWQGKTQDTVKLRIVFEKVRTGRNISGGGLPCITELELE